MRKIVYIAGHGHSGSTLLDLILGSHSEIESVGEVTPKGLGRLLAPSGPLCTCGRPFAACDYWQPILARLRAKETHGVEALLRSPGAFIDEVLRQSGKAVYAESTKTIKRMRQLLETPELDVRVIYVVRDPRANAFSYSKKYGGLFYRARRWGHLDTEIALTVDTERLLIVRYEDLATSPEAEVRRVMHFIGVEYQPSQLSFKSGVHHNIAGNRLRSSSDTTIKPDGGYLSLGLVRWYALTLLCLTSLPKYGYPITRSGVERMLMRSPTDHRQPRDDGYAH